MFQVQQTQGVFLSANPKNRFLIPDLPDFDWQALRTEKYKRYINILLLLLLLLRGQKEHEIWNWICNLGNILQTCATCLTASQEMTCFLLLDKFCGWQFE